MHTGTFRDGIAYASMESKAAETPRGAPKPKLGQSDGSATGLAVISKRRPAKKTKGKGESAKEGRGRRE